MKAEQRGPAKQSSGKLKLSESAGQGTRKHREYVGHERKGDSQKLCRIFPMNPWLKAKLQMPMARLPEACCNYRQKLPWRQEWNSNTRFQAGLVDIEALTKPERQELIKLAQQASI